MKLTISKSKNSIHFYVQRSVRVNKNKTSTVTVEKLGSIDEVRAKAGGKDPYVWAQEYVNELTRKEYEEQKEILVRYRPSKLISKNEQKAFNCGYLFLQKAYYELGLDKICSAISKNHSFEYDLNDILSKLVYTRVLYPSSKRSSFKMSKKFIEQPSFALEDIYRSLDILSLENDFIQSELYKNSKKVINRNDKILYYDCTNFFFEIEQEDDLRKYGKGKENRPLPIVGMGLFIDYDGIPLAFDIFPGNKNEQPTLKPLEEKIIREYGLNRIVICTDAGLSSTQNRKFNNKIINGETVRGFITTQSIKMLPDNLKEYALAEGGWHLSGSKQEYTLTEIIKSGDTESIYYKDKWIKEDISDKKVKGGETALEQHLIVSFSLKYMNYQRCVRSRQIERAEKLVNTGEHSRKTRNQNDPKRFIKKESVTSDGEIANIENAYIDRDVIAEEERYDGFYAVCTNLEEAGIDDVIHVNKKRWQIEESFRIMKTEFRSRPAYVSTPEHIPAHFLTCFIALYVYRYLEKKLERKYTCEDLIDTMRDMMMQCPGDKLGYVPAYTRTDITDALHEVCGFRTDYEICTNVNMKKIIRNSKGRK